MFVVLVTILDVLLMNYLSCSWYRRQSTVLKLIWGKIWLLGKF